VHPQSIGVQPPWHVSNYTTFHWSCLKFCAVLLRFVVTRTYNSDSARKAGEFLSCIMKSLQFYSCDNFGKLIKWFKSLFYANYYELTDVQKAQSLWFMLVSLMDCEHLRWQLLDLISQGKCIVKAFLLSIALYRSETWTLQKSDIKRIEAFEMWIWHRMLTISWTEHKRKDEVLKTVETRRELMGTRTVLEGRLPGKKGRGRPKEMPLSWLLETSEENTDYWQL